MGSRPPSLDDIVTMVAAQLRTPGGIDIGQFASRFPEHADQLRETLPKLVDLFCTLDLGPMADGVPSPAPGPPPGTEAPAAVGKYEILGELGSGAMGVVYRAKDREIGRHVALKLVNSRLSVRADALVRFRREAEAAARVTHPNIVALFEFGVADKAPYFAMELVEGKSLLDWIEERKKAGDPPPLNGSRSWLEDLLLRFARLADGLHEAHQVELVHRDIKPGNILLAKSGEMKLADFGLAKDLTAAQMSLEGSVAGTPMYMSPEQLTARVRIDRRADVYSLGATLYHLLALREPFEGAKNLTTLFLRVMTQDPPAFRALGLRCSRDLEAVLFKAMDKDRERRYPTAKDFADDLRSLAAGRVVRARLPGPLGRAARLVRRHRLVFAAACAVPLLAVLAWFSVLAYGAVANWMDARAARGLVAKAAQMPPASREEALAAVEREYPGSDALPGAWRDLGAAWAAAGHYDSAKKAWARSFHLDPDATPGGHAMLDLARMFLDESRMRAAREAADLVRGGDPPAEVRARALLLSVECAMAEGAEGEARWFLDRAAESAGDLPAAERSRLSRVRWALETFLPASTIATWGDGGAPHSLAAGRFVDGGPGLAEIVDDQPIRILEGIPNGLEPVQVGGLPIRGGPRFAGCGDLDGDGLDELLSWAPEEEGGDEGPLRAYRIRGGQAEEVAIRIPALSRSSYRIEVGDVDADGSNDVLLAMSYPRRGVRILRNTGSALLDLPLGDLEIIRDTNSDAMSIAVADLTGDGRNEVIVGTGPFGLFSVLVFAWDPVEETFRRLDERRAGFVVACRPVRDPVSGRDRVLLALSHYDYANSYHLYPEFLPTGLYELGFDPGGGTFGTAPLESFGKAVLPDGDGRPSLEGIHSFSRAATGVAGRPFAAVRAYVKKVKKDLPAQLRLLPLFEPGASGVVLGANSGPAPLVVFDFDGDGQDEIVETVEGGLRLFGFGGTLDPVEPAGEAGGRRPRRGPVDLNLQAGRTLLGELPAAAETFYRAGWERGRGEPEGRLFGSRLFDALVLQSKYEECLALVEEIEREYPGEAGWWGFLRALVSEKTWDLAGAARQFVTLRGDRRLSRSDDLHVESRVRDLSPWLEMVEEDAGRLAEFEASDWKLLSVGSDGVIRAGGTFHGSAFAESPVEWGGEDFRLEFDLLLHQVDWSGALQFGFVDTATPAGTPGGLFLNVTHTSSAPLAGGLEYQVPGEDGALAAETIGTWNELGRLLPPDTPLHCVLTSASRLGRVSLVIRDRETRELLALLETQNCPPRPRRPFRLALRVEVPNRNGAGGEVDATISTIRLSRPAGAVR